MPKYIVFTGTAFSEWYAWEGTAKTPEAAVRAALDDNLGGIDNAAATEDGDHILVFPADAAQKFCVQSKPSIVPATFKVTE